MNKAKQFIQQYFGEPDPNICDGFFFVLDHDEFQDTLNESNLFIGDIELDTGASLWFADDNSGIFYFQDLVGTIENYQEVESIYLNEKEQIIVATRKK